MYHFLLIISFFITFFLSWPFQLNLPMDLNAFPDLVLRAIFDEVPILDLGRHIPLVCHRWHALQPSVLSGKVKALTIVVGPEAKPTAAGESIVSILPENQLTNEDGSRMFPSPMDDPKVALTLTFDNLTSNRVDSLIGALRNVEYLKIIVRKAGSPVAETIPLIGRLLGHWAGSLKTFKLDCSLTGRFELSPDWTLDTVDTPLDSPELLATVAVQLTQLIVTVNALPLLEHLTLDLHEDLRKVTEPLDLSILGRLKEFYFSNGTGNADLLFGSLRRYAEPNRQLSSIGLGNYEKVDKYLTIFGQSPLAKRFSMLSHGGLDIFYMNTNVEERKRFLKIFSNLTFFTLNMSNLNLEQLTTTLAPLTRLVHLFLVGVDTIGSFETDPVEQIIPLPSVKVLSLQGFTLSHSQLASPHWDRMFPNLQIIIIFHYAPIGCSICDFEKDSSEPEKVAPCVQRTLLTFKQQQFRRTLKKVYYCRNRDYDNIQVFTPDTI